MYISADPHRIEPLRPDCLPWPARIKLLHTRIQHLRNHCGLSVAFPNGVSVTCSNIISYISGMSQRTVTCPVDVRWNCPMVVSGIFQ